MAYSELENRIMDLKDIKPRQAWANNLKASIMANEQTVVRPSFWQSLIAKPAYATLAILTVIGGVTLAQNQFSGRIIATLLTNPSNLVPVVKNSQSYKYLDIAESKVKTLKAIAATNDQTKLSVAINESAQAIKDAAQNFSKVSTPEDAARMAAKVAIITEALNELERQGIKVAPEEARVLSVKASDYVQTEMGNTQIRMQKIIEDSIKTIDSSMLSDEQALRFEEIKDQYNDYQKEKDLAVLQEIMQKLLVLSSGN